MEKIIKLSSDKNNPNNYDCIGFITQDFNVINNVKKIDMDYIKYLCDQTVNIDDVMYNVYIVKFKDIPSILLDAIKNAVDERIESYNEKKINCFQAFKWVISLFNKTELTRKFHKKLIGDFGELIFIYKAKELGINIDEYLRKNDKHLYDFVIGNHYVEVKSSSKNLSHIKVNYRQLSESSDKTFVVSKFQVVENQTNIIQLLEKINSTNPLLVYLLHSYKTIFEKEHLDLLNETTVDLNNVECFVLEDDLLPEIKILKEGGLRNLVLEISITNSKKTTIGYIKKYIDELN